ncbi:hypothetical protein [Acetobacter thailandicus]|uniref:hypothetical protein n=1 Tax=Acetobacter thailandicus TaxID=1502842 RepID=UPI001BA4B144|nr:hypothetical protein [Acetobacter thailandicus]MBS0960845.1 hypothetical protein [Acetobacter thailandicus]MBS0981225.1 hypothetical protein [Acetobacter thailandicus]
MSYKKCLLLASILPLAACQVPSAKQRHVYNSLIGKSPVEIVQVLGVPTREFQVDGHTFYAYIDQQTDYNSIGGMGYGGMGYGGPGWGGGSYSSTAYTYTCQTLFDVVNNVVTGWTLRGNGC